MVAALVPGAGPGAGHSGDLRAAVPAVRSPCFVERTLAEITGLDLVGFARGLRGHGLAPSRVTVVLSVIRDLLVDAAAEGLIPVAPAVRLRLRRTGPPGRRAPVLRTAQGRVRACARPAPFLVGLLAEHCSANGGADLLFTNRRGQPIRNSDFLRHSRETCSPNSGQRYGP